MTALDLPTGDQLTFLYFLAALGFALLVLGPAAGRWGR